MPSATSSSKTQRGLYVNMGPCTFISLSAQNNEEAEYTLKSWGDTGGVETCFSVKFKFLKIFQRKYLENKPTPCLDQKTKGKSL
jgi:hypothetical protein